VTYYAAEKTGGAVPVDSSSYTISTSVNVRGNSGNLVRTGYTFAGWADNAQRTGRFYLSGDTYTVQTNDLSFYAAWTPNNYSITFDVNGASGSPSKVSDTYTVGSTVVRLALVGTMVKSGYNFGGWATQAVGTAMADSFTVSSNTTLYAQWNIASFTLTYNLDGGTGTVPNPTSVNYLQQFVLAPSTGFTKTIGNDTMHSSRGALTLQHILLESLTTCRRPISPLQPHGRASITLRTALTVEASQPQSLMRNGLTATR
jgi:uncharacterized repeat protein (TIGR02543 family)